MSEGSRVVRYHGDALDVISTLPDDFVDAVVTDPPYELGFMGRAWDASGIAYNVELWKQCFRVLKPGGHLLAFGGTRTSHRLAVAVEDAGFEIRDSIVWIYGSGFPKSLDVSKAIDRRPGVERHPEFAADLRAAMAAKGYTNTFDVAEAVVGRRTGAVANWQKYQWPEAKWWPALRDLLDMDEGKWGAVIAEAERQRIGERTTGIGTGRGDVAYIADSDNRDITAPATDGAKRWAGWGTALKPAHEPIVVGRKPLVGTVAANVLAHGTGALNIDACRVEMSSDDREKARVPMGEWTQSGTTGSTHQRVDRRFEPADAGRWPANVVLDEGAAAELDEQSGVSTSSARPRRNTAEAHNRTSSMGKSSGDWTTGGHDDSGGASRFFPVFRYQAKAPTRERVKIDGVAHPTVKPLELMRWLVRLVTQPDGVVLEPFAGSGTTVEACVLEGMRCLAIEREESYLPLIAARLERAGLVAW